MLETKAKGQWWSDGADAAPPVHSLKLAYSAQGSCAHTSLSAAEHLSLFFLEQLLVPVTVSQN